MDVLSVEYNWEATNWIGFTFTLAHATQPHEVWEVIDDKNPAPNSSMTPRYECALRTRNGKAVDDFPTRLFTQHALMGHLLMRTQDELRKTYDEITELENEMYALEDELERAYNGDDD